MFGSVTHGVRPFEQRGKWPPDLHCVSSAPSEISYGGFSSSTASNPLLAAANFTHRSRCAYRPPLFVSLVPGVGSVVGLASKRHRRLLT